MKSWGPGGKGISSIIDRYLLVLLQCKTWRGTWCLAALWASTTIDVVVLDAVGFRHRDQWHLAEHVGALQGLEALAILVVLKGYTWPLCYASCISVAVGCPQLNDGPKGVGGLPETDFWDWSVTNERCLLHLVQAVLTDGALSTLGNLRHNLQINGIPISDNNTRSDLETNPSETMVSPFVPFRVRERQS